MAEQLTRAELIEQFHRMWDAFPGNARLVTKDHEVIAANEIARKAGFVEGCICKDVGMAASHAGCKKLLALETGKTQTQLCGARIKGWMPVEGHPDLVLHFGILIPEE